jgi:drug/metabolite transporter (DMT)-like permease
METHASETERSGDNRRRQLLGAAAGVGSAVLFGASAPIAKRLLPHVPTVLLAGMLYAGAGLGLTAARTMKVGGTSEVPLRRGDWLTMGTVIGFGGILAPILLLTGLARVTGLVASLLLNLESVFTLVLAVTAFGERIDRRAASGAALIFVAAAALGARGGSSHADLFGVLAIVSACGCWGLDNNLTRRLSVRDPVQIVQVKTLMAGVFNVMLGLWLGERWQESTSLLPALSLGFVSYGISIVLDVYALRLVGAARESAYFATAPFAGALLALPVLHESMRRWDIVAGTVMAVGVWLMTHSRDVEETPDLPGHAARSASSADGRL